MPLKPVAAANRLHSRVEVIFKPPRRASIRPAAANVQEWGGMATTASRLDKMRGAGFEPANPYGTGF